MTRPSWIISSAAYLRARGLRTGQRSLIEAIQESRGKLYTVDWIGPESSIDPISRLDHPVIIHGGHRFLDSVSLHRPEWAPGVFHDPVSHGHAAVSAALGALHLNAEAEEVRLIDARRKILHQGAHFLRPSLCDKSFAGGVFDARKTSEIDAPDSLLVVISNPTKILAEYRLIISEGRYIAGSQYARNGRMDVRIDIDPQAIEIGLAAAEMYSPAPIFTCDVAETESGFRVVEYNSFSSSGHYACDGMAIMEAAEAAVLARLASTPPALKDSQCP